MATTEEIMYREALPLLSLNHVSLLCRSVRESVRFYEHVLGFVPIKRPSSFDFNGAWLFNYGTGIHLIENPSSLADYDIEPEHRPISPKDNHISFQCTDVELVKKRLQVMGMRYMTAVVEEVGVKVDQVFFHDPDGYMIEICNCDKIPVLPISSGTESSTCSLPFTKQLRRASNDGDITTGSGSCGGFLENVMMESLSLDMMNFSF